MRIQSTIRFSPPFLMAFALGGAFGQELPTPTWRFNNGDPGPNGVSLRPTSAPTAARGSEVLFWGLPYASSSKVFGSAERTILRTESPLGPGSSWIIGNQFSQCMPMNGVPWIQVDVHDGGQNFAAALLQGGRVVLAPGQLANAPGLPVGTRYITLWSSVGQSATQMLAFPFIDLPTQRIALVRLTTDGRGRLQSEELIAVEGGTHPAVNGVIGSINGGNSSPNGNLILALSVIDPTIQQASGHLIVNGALVLSAGDPSPIPGQDWLGGLGGIAINDRGDWAAGGRVTNGELVIIRNGDLHLRSTDLPPEVWPMGAELLQVWGMTSNGRVVSLVVGRIGPTMLQVGVYLDDRPILVGNHTVLAGDGVFSGLGFALCPVDPDGVYLGVTARLVGPAHPLRSLMGLVIPLDQSGPVCSNGPTSAGESPTIGVHGSRFVVDGTPLEILTNGVPPQTVGVTFVGRSPGMTVNPGGALGSLCLSAPLWRSSVLRASSNGAMRTYLADVVPSVSAPQPGDTLYFQTWFRDIDAAGASVSRLTEARSVVFE